MDESQVAIIHERLLKTLELITEATVRSGREAGTARLVVVTKSQPLETVQAAIKAGATKLGENYAEEALSKMEAIRDPTIEWHMIGHVQSRKADLVARKFSMLHSLDSLKLAERLNRICLETNRKLNVLLEVNVSGEESKFGFPGWEESSWTELVPISKQINEFSGLQLRGLMTMPPFLVEPGEVRPFFLRLRLLRDYLKECLPLIDWSELSMGTSGDFVTAIEEGATMVRVGQAILGPRPK